MRKRITPELRGSLQERSVTPWDSVIRWMVALLIAALWYTLCKKLGLMYYHTNDDASIQDFLSGKFTGTPLTSHPFIHIFLSWCISRLYVLIPGVEWWYMGCKALMVGGMVLINFSLLSLTQKNRYSFGLSVVLLMITDGCLMCCPLCRSCYTMVSGIVGTAGLCLLLSSAGERNIAAGTVSYMLFVLAFCIRISVGYVLACFYLLVVLLFCLKSRRNRVWKAGLLLMAALVFIGTAVGLTAVNSHFQKEINGADFLAFNSARSAYIDYPHDTYEENPALYESVGWSRETTWLVNEWCFMDERVTTENLRYLTENSRKERKSLRPGILKERFFELQKKDLIPHAEWFWILTALFALIAVASGKQKHLLAGFCLNVIGSAVLILYQLYGGRILYRTFYICILPSAMINLMLGSESLKSIPWKRAGAVLAGLVVLCGFFVAGSTAGVLFNREKKSRILILKTRADALGEYVLSHPENTYIEDTKTVHDIFPSSPRPVNLVEWGKPDFHSKAHRLKLEANGIENLTGEVMKRQDVFFISGVSLADRENSGKKLPVSNRLRHFYAWLKQEYSATGIRQADQAGSDLFVYQFVFDGSPSGEKCYDIREDGTVTAAGG